MMTLPGPLDRLKQKLGRVHWRIIGVWVFDRALLLQLRSMGNSILSNWFAIALQLVFNLILFVLTYVYTYDLKVVYGPPLATMAIDIAMVAAMVCDRMVKKKHKLTAVTIKRIEQLCWISIMMLLVTKIIQMGSGTIRNPLPIGDEDSRRLALSFEKRCRVLALNVLAVLSDCYMLSVCWVFRVTFASLVFIMSFMVNFVLAMLQIQLSINHGIEYATRSNIYSFFIYVGGFTVSGSILGACLLMNLNKSHRFNPIFKRLISFLMVYYCLLTILAVVAFSVSVNYSQKEDLSLSKAILIIIGCCMFIDAAVIWCTSRLWVRYPVEFEAEQFNLKDLKPYQKDAYAKLISSNARSNPGVSGEHIIPLMESYCESRLQQLECMVLRVYDPNKTDRTPKAEVFRRKFDKSYEYEDNEKFFFGEVGQDSSAQVLDTLKPMSKNQRKRLAKKAAASTSVQLPMSQDLSDKSFEEEARFYAELLTTEALVLISVVKSYDLTLQIPGRAGKVLGKLFGKNSWLKLLCIRVGLLGFHWPFRHSTFYCKGSKNQPYRDASILNAIAKFNKLQTKCTVLIDPIFSSTKTDKTIQLSDWINIVLPPSNIIDLRPHKNKPAFKFFKAVKYRTHSEAFRAAGGEIVEDKEFANDNCHRAMALWSNIASQRSTNGFSSYFANPDADFFKTMGTCHNSQGSRSLLFLKVEGQFIASCIIFRLGQTITSDLQGLDYEMGKTYKAYFVMMEAIVKIALEEKKDFIDFGPTTDAAKHSIGCHSVHLTGAIYTTIPCMSGIIKFAASKVNV